MKTIKEIKNLMSEFDKWSHLVVQELQELFESKYEEFDMAPLLCYNNNEITENAYFLEVGLETENDDFLYTLHFYYDTHEVDLTTRGGAVEFIPWFWEYLKTKGQVRTY